MKYINAFQYYRSFSAVQRIALLLFLLFFTAGCKSKQTFNTIALNAQRKSLNEKYSKIPHEEILEQIAGNRVYTELQQRYRASLMDLKNAVDSDNAKMVVVIMSPDAGKFATLANTVGVPFITAICNQSGIDCINLTTDIGTKEEEGPDQYPVENTWSKSGATYLETLLEGVVTRYGNYESNKTYTGAKPPTFGDLPPKDDEIVDGDKNQQYRLTVNSQGLRMDHNLTFPKKKQTLLFLGGTQLYSPYLDNNFTAISLLQQKFPGKELVNAGNTSYTVEDFLSLYHEKARFTEPDVVFVCTNGDDILNFFFSQRNRFSRSAEKYEPSEQEKQYYEQMFN